MVRARLAALAVVLTGFLAFASAAQAADYIVVLKDGVSEPTVAADHTKKGAEVTDQYQSALNGYAATLSDSELATVRADNRVDFVARDKDFTLETQTTPRSMRRIDADLSSTRSGDGRGKVNINVAVIDTGIDPTHPDLNVVGGVNCAKPKSAGFDDPTSGHGTLNAGIIAARDNDIGYVGVVPGARLWAVNTLRPGANRIKESAFLCGVDWVTSTRTDKNPNNDIAVANTSLGGDGYDDGNCGRLNNDPLHLAYCRSTAAGVTHVVSAGNDAIDFGLATPAAYNEVLTATAITDYDGESGGTGVPDERCAAILFGDEGPDDTASTAFSNFAVQPSDQAHTLAASGVCISSTYPMWGCASLPPPPPGVDYCYAQSEGTSHSAPAVAGTAALCISTGECSGTPKQIIRKLVNDAARYNQRHPGYGFVGDPLRPIAGSYYGWLIRAGLY